MSAPFQLKTTLSDDRAENGYAEQVGDWIANPHAYFKSFSPEVRTFQKNPSGPCSVFWAD